MRSLSHGESAGDEATLKKFAERLEARFAAYKALGWEEPPPVAQCFPGGTGLLGALEQVTQWLDESPPGHGMAGGAQSPLPGLETPPCR